MVEPNQRRADAEKRRQLAAGAAEAEARAAQPLLDAFVADLADRGLAPEPLQATLLNGRRVKTPLVGWYLNKAATLAVDPQARYYMLVTAGSALARFTGVEVAPSAPTLVIGRGGRDGETGDLTDFLARALETYESRRAAGGGA